MHLCGDVLEGIPFSYLLVKENQRRWVMKSHLCKLLWRPMSLSLLRTIVIGLIIIQSIKLQADLFG